ncbi:Phosphoglycerate mutase-like protein AT74H [Glycine soja]
MSPYAHTQLMFHELRRCFAKKMIIGMREESFFYRFPKGESAVNVFDHISSFFESLWRDIHMNRLRHDPSNDLNFVIVSHGLTSRVFLMKWFKWTVEQFEHLNNFGNCEFRVMQLESDGEYSLAVNHTEE